MTASSRVARWWPSIAVGAIYLLPVPLGAQAPPQAAGQTAQVKISIDQAIQMALQQNHALQAARTTILQGQAQETTANLRPNPVLLGDSQFLPFFQPGNWNSDYLSSNAQFDLGVSYLFERGGKRQARLAAAKDQTAVTTSQVADNGRTLSFNVASQFIAALLAESNLDFAQQDLASFQQTVDVSQASFNAGATSQGDLLKIKLQLLQFQMDVSSARLARVQALASLRQLLGYNAVPADYDVDGSLAYQAVTATLTDLQALALRERPDLRAAQLGITAAESQLALAQSNGKRDLTAQFSYSHVASTNTGSLFANIEIPVFNRNQGEIARTRYVITQSQELSNEQNSIVMTDVANALEGVRSNEQVVQLYESGYLTQAQDSRDIAQYAYQRGSATILDFLDAQRSYRGTQLAYRQALANYMVTLEQLREAAGTRSLP